MIINPMKWKTRTLACVCLGLCAFYLMFIYKWAYNVHYEATIENSKPVHVWEFVADFSNMLKLNPTIQEFSIINESGNFDHWQYSVQYTERLSHFPVIQSTSQGHFSIIPKTKSFVIESKHSTCFFYGLNCLSSESEFIFEPKGQDTKCIEKIKYQCPLVLSSLCYKEVMYQRKVRTCSGDKWGLRQIGKIPGKIQYKVNKKWDSIYSKSKPILNPTE